MSDPQKQNEMLYPISVDGKWGFIDSSGAAVIQPQFLSAGKFSEGLAKVSVPGFTDEDRRFERNAVGFIDAQGNFAIGPGSPPGFEFPEHHNLYSYGDFHDGLARFWIGDASGSGGYIDRSGKVVIFPEYADAGDFSEGFAFVSLPREDGSPFGPKLSGFIDRTNEFVIPPGRHYYAYGFSEGLSILCFHDDKSGYLSGVINTRGEYVIPPNIYSSISSFSGGLARAAKDCKVGCINAKGEIIIPFGKFDHLWEFDQGKFTTGEKNGQLFIVDRKGRCVTEIDVIENAEIGPLRSGMATIKSGEKHGYANSEGELVIPIQFDSGEDFDGPLTHVTQGTAKGYINKQGTFVWKTEHWDEPIRNAVEKPLSDYLPPKTIEALPLEYNWQGVENAIVFATNESVGSLQPWFITEFGKRFRLIDESSHPRQFDISFFADKLSGSFHAVALKAKSAEGFIEFYSSKNMKALKEKHHPRVLGILILHR